MNPPGPCVHFLTLQVPSGLLFVHSSVRADVPFGVSGNKAPNGSPRVAHADALETERAANRRVDRIRGVGNFRLAQQHLADPSGGSAALLHPALEGLDPAPLATTPEAVAEAIVRGLERGSEIVWVPPALRWVMTVLRHVPRPLFRKLPL